MKIKVLLFTLILAKVSVGWAQPNWTVNESDFQYSMTLIARINVDGRMLENSNDRVGAFVNGQLRGVAAPSFVAAQNKYFTYLTIFSNQQGETINFRLYDASTNSTRSVEMTLRFVANKHTGSFFQSVSIADPPLNTAAAIERFSFVNVPLNDSIIQPPNYTYYIPNIISKETLIPVFTLSDGATAHIDRRDQISGESQVDFTQPVIYQILSEDQSTLNTYTFTVEHSFNDYDGDGREDEFDLDDDDDCFSDLVEEQLGTNPFDAADQPADADGDCIPDALDDDNDNDTLTNDEEQTIGTDPLIVDTDGDGVNDPEDDLPTDPTETIDSDGDGIGDNADTDDDNDCFSDLLEQELGTNPFNANDKPSDVDGDCIPDVQDDDNDNDTLTDDEEQAIGTNPLLVDTDDDGVNDAEDDLPTDPTETVDLDGDGIGDNADLDDDNDCFPDLLEVELGTYPFDPTDKPADQDGDCIPDVQDDDANGDGYLDDVIFVNEFFSPNGDGINDQWVILNIERFNQNHVWIYTRSGQLVLDVSNYQNDWGGTLQGQDLPEGNYYYRIDQYGSGQISLEGWVYMSR